MDTFLLQINTALNPPIETYDAGANKNNTWWGMWYVTEVGNGYDHIPGYPNSHQGRVSIKQNLISAINIFKVGVQKT
jgi:hypothetical protein